MQKTSGWMRKASKLALRLHFIRINKLGKSIQLEVQDLIHLKMELKKLGIDIG
jgi:hypothetical protein